MKVKICGIRTERDLDMAVNAGADAVGFIAEVPVDSSRKISLYEAAKLISKVPLFVTSVLVIMPENAEHAIQMIHKAKPSAVQVHNPLAISDLKKIRETGAKLIKTIPVPQHVEAGSLIKQVSELSGIVDAVLLDTLLEGRTGGTGAPHNWEVSSEIVLHAGMPVILAGGLSPENVRAAVRTVRPYAVDTASGVETDGRKDEKKIIAFIRNARMHEI